MNDLISIVVTSYNHVDFLRQRMESLLFQTYPNLEIIVVDDGSTDGSRELLGQFADNPKIRLFLLEKNHGFVHASNFGVSQANGEYIVFAECDDFSEPEQIATLHQVFAKQESVGVVYSRSNLVDQDNKPIGIDYHRANQWFKNSVQSDILVPGQQMQKFLLFSCVIPNMSAAMFRKPLFERVNGLSDQYRLAADLDFWLKISEITDFYYITRPLNNFRQHESTVRNEVGRSVQLIESIRITTPVSRRINLSGKEKMNLKINHGASWLYFAIEDLPAFARSFFKVWSGCLKKEPFLLFFLLLNIPLLAAKKLGRQFRNPERSLSGRENQRA